jgi:16S rRNA G966 N2-methylase RsmD
MTPGAWVVAEHSRRDTLPEAAGMLTRRELRRYGDTQVAFYINEVKSKK